MGLFSGITDAYKKSEAAVVVQNLLDHQARIGLFDVDATQLANQLVSLVWDVDGVNQHGRSNDNHLGRSH